MIYHCVTSDGNDCELHTGTLTVLQPATPLEKLRYDFHDVICHGEAATIGVNFSGGWGNYTYHYQHVEDGSTHVSQLPDYHPTQAGSYRIWVVDSAALRSGVCHVPAFDTAVAVTVPPAPLTLQIGELPQKSNGFHISCKDAADGLVPFAATGGNGGGYQDYTVHAKQGAVVRYAGFSVGELLNDTLSSFRAGTWRLYAKDGRGCLTDTTLTFTLTEPAADLLLRVDSVKNNWCYQDSAGKVWLHAVGGVQPYNFEYGKFAGMWQDSSLFAGLKVDLHMRFTVRDQGGCLATADTALRDISRRHTSLWDSVTNATCYNVANGRYLFSPIGDLAFAKYTWNGNVVPDTLIENVAVDTHLIEVEDVGGCYCSQSVIVLQPDSLIVVQQQDSAATCISVPNGWLRVTTQGGSSQLSYSLVNVESSIEVKSRTIAQASFHARATGSDTVLFDSIAAGKYILSVTDECGRIFYTSDTLDFYSASLSVAHISYDSLLRCFGDTYGKVEVVAQGGIGQYWWSLKRVTPSADSLQHPQLVTPHNAQTFGSNTANFENLSANYYQISLSNFPRSEPSFTECPDVVNTTIHIAQHTPIRVAPTLSHVACYGDSSGTISLSVSGGLPHQEKAAYRYVWSTGKNADTAGVHRQLTAGAYACEVRDLLGCHITIGMLVLIQPANSLRKHGYRFHDIICYGDSANLHATFSGGWGSYTYLYQHVEQGFIDTTLTPRYQPYVAGHYKVWVEDRDTISGNVCHRAGHDTMVVVSRPSAPLQLRVVDILRQENGFHVSCRGSRDGGITFCAEGGNGEENDMLSHFYSYNRYTITARQGAEILQKTGYNLHDDYYGIAYLCDTMQNFCGDGWTLHVTDDRGCTSRDTAFVLTVPAQHLFIFVDSVIHNTCANDSVGQVLLRPEGGIAPYYYRYDNGAWQDSGRFTHLQKNADVLFTLRDSASCLSEVRTSLRDLTRPITITDSVVNVSCYGFADARYYFYPSGDLPFAKYTFDTAIFYAAPITDIAAGTYRFYAWDTAGCFGARTVHVTQPAPLQAYVEGKPVCSNDPFGYLTATVQGGTRPYAYRLTHESTYYIDSVLPSAAGVQQVEVKDAQGCLLTTEPYNVEVRTLEPQPAFLVSTHSLKGDTLMLVEYSQPDPDSVQWHISGDVSHYVDSAGHLHLLMQRDGEATVRMVAYYEGCDFEVEKPVIAHEFDTMLYDYRGRGAQPDILDVQLSPNPMRGEMRLKVTLSAPQVFNLWVRDITGSVVLRKQYGAADEVVEDIVQLPASGARHLLFTLYTSHDVKTQRVVQQE